MLDVICLGELLIDFVSTEKGIPLAASPAFAKKPGGAPANVHSQGGGCTLYQRLPGGSET